jgi:hypothetical protein
MHCHRLPFFFPVVVRRKPWWANKAIGLKLREIRRRKFIQIRGRSMKSNQLSGPGYGKRGQSLFPVGRWPGHGGVSSGEAASGVKSRPSDRLTFNRQLAVRV